MLPSKIAGCLMAVAGLAAVTACGAADENVSAASSTSSAAASSSPQVSTLLAQALPNVAGKTFTSSIVDFPPGTGALPHRHGQAFVFAYVLEGAVRSQLDDKPATTYHQGENWVEQPGAHHVVAANPSTTKRARLLVVYISNTGDKLKVDDPH